MLQVGHLERFSAAHGAVASRMGRPLYIEATRIAPFKPRGTDVSVILDLMIHDLDLILSLVDSPIASVDAVGAAVASPHEDIANARVRFDNGCVATDHREPHLVQDRAADADLLAEGYLAVDFAARRLTLIGRGRGMPIPGIAGFRRGGGLLGGPGRAGGRARGLRRLGAGRRAGAGGCGGRAAGAGGGARGHGVAWRRSRAPGGRFRLDRAIASTARGGGL